MHGKLCIAPMAIAIVLAAGWEPLAAGAGEPGRALPPGLEMLRRTERAFAKATSEIGVRNGFLMFFAEDAVSPPDTAPARAALLARPAPVEPRPGNLAWEPLYGDISRSGDLGYLTGPFSFSDAEGAKHHGVYFSIWKRDAAGLWRVVLDAGIDIPSEAPEFAGGEFRAAPQSAAGTQQADPEPRQQVASLEKAGAEFLAAAASGIAGAYEKFLSEPARLHRSGRHPQLGRDAILAELRKQPATLAGKLVRVHVAAAGDLGWTLATCDLTAQGATQKCTVTQVWKRNDEGRWRIAVDVLSPPRE